jgi:hypothetical protein
MIQAFKVTMVLNTSQTTANYADQDIQSLFMMIMGMLCTSFAFLQKVYEKHVCGFLHAPSR